MSSGSSCPPVLLPVLTEVFSYQADMKMTYSELSVIGRLRKISMCGPFSMFCKLIHQWKDVLSPVEVSVLLLLWLFYLLIGPSGAPHSSLAPNLLHGK